MGDEPDPEIHLEPNDESEEKTELDSLFTVKEDEERIVTLKTPSEYEPKFGVEYKIGDLEKIVGWVKDFTTLYDLRPEDWTFEHDNTISEFFLNGSELLMMIYFNQNNLYVTLGVPEASFMDATYFYKEPNQVFTVENFHDTINFGTVDNNVEGCLLAVMQNVYAPVFFSTTHWPDSVKNDFGHKIHMFLAKLTDLHYKLFGLTVLYIPHGSVDLQIDVASRDKELVKRLEGIVVFWTKQVRVGLQDQDQTTPEDLLMPTDEIQFWKYRYKNLKGLSFQLENKGLKQVCDILTAVQSTYVRQFLVLVDEIKHNVEEAKSNIEYLQVLREPCMLMSDSEDPSKIPECIPPILQLVRFIWQNNKNLKGLSFQLENKGLKQVCDILTAVQSTYVRQFLVLVDEIKHNVEEAKSNIEYLQVLREPCMLMSDSEDPSKIPECIPPILQLVRFIWQNSKYYNTPERITLLCRAISNQIIIQCTDYINLDLVFSERATRKAIEMFNTCINCLTQYIKSYVLISQSHTLFSNKPWMLNTAPIFNHIDSLIQRCKDMIEVCESMITFGRYDETEVLPKPIFGGSRGAEFGSWVDKVEVMFNNSLDEVASKQTIIFDVQVADWYDEILKFRSKMKDIEVVMENLTNAVFDEVGNVEEGIENLGAMFNYSKRKTLHSLFEGKTLFVYQMFRQEIQDIKQDLIDETDDHPSRLPYYAGRAMIARLKKNRLMMIKQLFDDAKWLMPCSLSSEIFSQYEKLISSIDDRVLNIFRKCLDNIGDGLPDRLNRPLMIKSSTRYGLLECNIDRTLLKVFEEVKYWECLGYEIPTYINSVCQKSKTIRIIYESVLAVVMDYNKILTSLSEEERLLFKPLISTVEKKISPGLSKLTWGAGVGDEYIEECSNTTAELQIFVDTYKTCNLKIVSICEKICDTPLINLPTNYAFELQELQTELKSYMEKTIDKLVAYYQEIIEYLIVVFEGFENHMAVMANQWIKYINNFDNLVEKALKVCCKNSLESMYEAVHGDDITGPNPLLKLVVNLKDNSISFDPRLSDVAAVISNILPSIVQNLRSVPRLNDKFHVAATQFTPFFRIIEDDKDCIRLQEFLNEEVLINAENIQQYMNTWEPFRDLWEIDKDKFIVKYESKNPNAASFDANMGRYTEFANNVQMQETVMAVHFTLINSDLLKRAIIEHCIKWQEKLAELLLKLTVKKIKHVHTYVSENVVKILKEPTTLKEMQDALLLHNLLKMEVPDEEAVFPTITEQVEVLDKFRVQIGEDIRILEKEIPKVWFEYLETLDEAEKMLGYSQDGFKNNLLENSQTLRAEAMQALDDFMAKGPFGADINPKDALAYIANMRAMLIAMRANEEQLRRDLAIFGLSLPDCEELTRLEKELATLEIVWQLADEWETAWEKYRDGVFWDIETEEMEEKAQTLFRKLTRLSRELKDKNWDIVESTRLKVDAFRRTLPLLADLKNPAMRPRHWDRVRTAMNKEFDEHSPDFNMGAIFAMEFHLFAEEVNEISNAATMELQIERGLLAIAETWKVMLVELVPHREKGMYRIKSVDDAFAALEENMIQLSTMKSTRFVEPFQKEVDFWEKTLTYIMETLESALIVQRQYLYLENIFYGDDIRKQLPKETEDFERISVNWIDITANMFAAGTALKATHFQPPPYLYNKLGKLNDKLEMIQRALERYLETKRYVFPRFYFISNDDMLEILGNAKKPEAIQPHLKKLFDNLTRIKLQKNIGLNKLEAVTMYSDDGEEMNLTKPVLVEGPVELWLVELEKSMRLTLKTEFKPCRSMLKKMLNKRDKWLMTYCGQLCNACSQIQWTTDCTRALVHAKIMESKKPLKKLRKKQNQVLSKLSELSRRELTKIQRLKANALITIEIHCRDVIDRMYKANCRDTNAFEWFSQLRFYWDRDVDDCVIKQTNTSFWYGYEYNGNSGRLVITPLTDRCYITLTTALHLFRGGSPKGPAGTGKTETVKDLGKAMGMWVIVNNCSEGLDYKSMGKCFSGLAQTGAWGCFDEFNRINIEVLSVVAQQILCILSAIAQKLTRVVFEGAEINLKSTCGIFITMNPGYAGRTELPDNLKSMFRPISMMVPDSGIIAENILFSDGFQSTKVLAKKVFTLYQLAMKQLSKQDHYDFGLRSMVALLRYAGRRRRMLSHLPEEQVVYLAMRDMNVARFTSDDTPLFNGIMSDIFPGVTIPTVDYIDMNTAIIAYMTKNTLQPIPIALTKVIQLYETKSSRHSVMILGKTNTAKSVTWQALQGALGILQEQKKPGYRKVQVFPINPKALNLGELYGEYNLATNEWLDGVISAIMRTTCSDESPDEKWILFDGPVDAVWIENMNSVMDDNKVLTLINSDRITMPEQVSLLFEVGDLTVASPATVSRCGMVYNDYKDWGWLPYVTSWVQKQAHRGKKFQDTMMTHFNGYLNSIMEFKRLNCEETVICAELNLVKSLCILLEIFVTKENGVNPDSEETFEEYSKIWFLFCLIWSVCCTINEIGRKKLDVLIREKESCFPIKDTIYEYFVDTRSRCFAPWEDKLPYGWRYDSNAPFFKIIVPTVDTIRYQFILSALLNYGYPALVTGPVGTGKTSTCQTVLNSMDKEKYMICNINMSAQTSSQNLQDFVESRVEKRTKGVFVPIGGKKMITFLDDLNMPAKEFYGSQPPLELLRQWIDYGFWYDRDKQVRRYIQNMFILASMGPPGGGRNVISDRLLSRFNVINMTFPDDSIILRIFGTMLSQHVAEFDDEVKMAGRDIPETTLDLYNNVSNTMLPTPTKIHYLFNLRDISKIFQGLLRSHKDYQNTKTAFLRLWIHECYRVFYDRLIDDNDREWFLAQMNEQLGSHYELTVHALCPKNEIPIYADFVNVYRIYEDLPDLPALRKFLENEMEEYNVSPGVVPQDLVLFKDAIDHICRIVRVISQPRGNMLLVGIGGSGRQSLSRISAYLCEYSSFQINVTRSYKTVEFKEDLKKLYNITGVNNKPTCFLFNDTQITDDSFLEIINNMLSSGEVANLYKPEEFDEVKNKIYNAAVKAGVLPTQEGITNFLIDRVRSNLHIILCMSPIGSDFRNRLRQYPALINCSTIDWFTEWPKEALLEVAYKYIADVNFVEKITGEAALERRRESVIISSQDRLRTATADVFSVIHDSVAKKSKQMAQEMKRFNYVTPTNYLELVARYKVMLKDKREEIAEQANKLRSGVWKIEDCRQKVEIMSVELEEAQTKVAEFQVQCDEYLIIIVAQKKEADEQAKEVGLKSVKIGEEEVVCKRLASVAQADLDEAMPALNEAIAALDALSKKDISELKSYGKPPEKVQMVMEAVMILKGVDTSWAESKRQLGEMNFLQALKDFDKNHISEKTLKKIAQYTTNEEFQPDKVGIVSFAAKSLCMWVIAIEKYAKVWKVVGPKQEKLDLAMASLAEKQRLLAEAQAKLAELQAMLAKLQQEYEEKLQQKEELNRKAELLKLKLERAAMLVENLSGEAQRWGEAVVTLDSAYELLPGNCLLSNAFISYLGPFVSIYRMQMMKIWIDEVISQEIPCSPDFNIINFLSDATLVREWNMQGLPADSFSTENGIIVTKSSRWPLLIDPQCQAMKWIKAKEQANGLMVIDFGMVGYMKIIENAVQTGFPVLLQNIMETVDPSINPILSKAVFKQGGMNLIKLDDKMVSYNDDFRFFITTKLTNPHYAPEISTKTIIVNFAVKEEGLEAQLLGIVVRKEKPQLEEQKDKLVTTISKGKRTLVDLENELLRLLNESRGSILEDAELFTTLQVSKATSQAVKKSVEVSETTEVEIDLAREGYRPCAKRASILFFVLNDMGRIDPMYQFALDSYIFLFDKSIDSSEKSGLLPERIVFLNDYHTFAVYKNTCRALFEHHKLLFSFHMCVKILSAEGKIVEAEYNFLLTGGVVLDRENQIDKPGAWMPDEVWDNITELDKIGGFHGVIDTFEQYTRDWHQWYTNTEPENLALIGEWNEICNEFQKMLFIRSLRQDRVSFCITNFIVNQLGPRFVEPPVLDIKAVLEESVPQTPLIFVLSPGVDPTTALVQLAEVANMSSKFGSLSLGQGQAPIATKMIQNGAREGQWIFLANCHLSLSWMPRLDKLVENLQTGKVHNKFRLWLSSSPNPDFPISILQAGIKMTTEPPKGLKANLKRLYNIITEEQFSVCEAREKYKKLLFALCFFHSILLERKKFQQLGWNVIYSFNDSDFEVSENLLAIYLDEYPQTPWDALKYLISGVNYGGHVTDDWDRRLLTTYINQFFCEDAINVSYYRLSSLPTFYIPRDGSLHSYQDYITLLPHIDRPEAFGQHPNADITSQIIESRNLFETLMSLQIQSSSGQSESKEDKVEKLASDVLSKIPNVIDYENTEKLIGAEKKPLDVVLLQEISRYNVLLVTIKTSLEDLQKGIKGLVVMSAELEEIFICVHDGRVPSGWLKTYPSMKLLGSWTRDLLARVDHFNAWAVTTHPPLFFWLAAYTFPTGFLTAVLQTTARTMEVPIDTLSWEFTVQTLEEHQLQLAPEVGVYVRGIFLEGAGWDRKPACLIEPQPMQLVCAMPLIHFKPVEQLKKKTKGLYQCPTYYYPIRTGSQQQPSFVVAVDLKSGTENSDFWIKRGTALLLSLG